MAPSPPSAELGIARLCAICREAALFDDETFAETLDDEGIQRLVFPQNYERTQRRIIRADTLPDLPELDSSSQAGCDFCGFLRGIIKSTDTNDLARTRFGKGLDELETCGVSIYVSYCWKGGNDECRGDGVVGMVVELDFVDIEMQLALCCLAEGIPGTESTMRWLGLAAPSSQSYLEEHRVEWMLRKLEECTEHGHEPVDEIFIPERLVDVREPNPRLVLRSDLQASNIDSNALVYTALSYCWGSPQDAISQLKTTAASMAQRQAAITGHEMTKVLRDAVAVTRALSISYIWVDSLCILQDDISDWELQCVDMCKIYGNARVTLCAASSTSCHEGFLRQRGNRIRMPFQSAKRPTITGSYYIQFHYADDSNYQIFDDLCNDWTLCRWHRRGWAFQEGVSSTRKLVFGNANIHFICDRSYGTMGSKTDYGSYGSQLPGTRGQHKDKVYLLWHDLLLNYSKFDDHSFTKATDTLPALSGVAIHFAEILQDDYLAGHWRRHLLRGLIWFRPYSPSRTIYLSSLQKSPENYVTPSWSMVGRGGVSVGIDNMSPHYSDLRPESELLDANTELVGGNRFGAIKAGNLNIRSHVLCLALLGKTKLSVIEGGGIGIWFLRYGGKDVGRFYLDFTYTPSRWGRYEHEDAGILNDIESITWVLLGSCKVRHLDEPENKARQGRGAFGLVLYPVPDSDEFYRVGVFFPAEPGKHSDGLRLFKEEGEVRTIIVI